MGNATDILKKRKKYGSSYYSIANDTSKRTQSASDILNNRRINKYRAELQSMDIKSLYDLSEFGLSKEKNTEYQTKISDYKTTLENLKKYDSSISDNDYNDYIKSLDSLSNNLDVLSQYKTEDDYNKAVESQKNREEMFSFDLDAGNKEIENLKIISEKATNASKGKTNLSYNEYYNAYKRAGYGDAKAKELANNAVNNNNKINSNIDAEIAGYLEGTGYKSLQELNDAIAKKSAYYNRAKLLQENEKLKNDAINASDFKEYSQKGDIIVNPSQKEAEGWLNIGNIHVGGADVGNIVTYSRDNYAGIRMGSHMVGNAKYHYMTNDEVSIYNYYLAKENEGTVNKGTAQQYLDSLEDTLNQREAGEIFEKGLKDNTALELVFGVNAGLDQFKSGIKNLFNTEDNYIAPSSTQYASQMVREDLADDGPNIFGSSLGQAAYDLITTTSNMLPSIAASTIVGIINPTAGQVVGTALMGASASGNAYQEMLNLGYNKSQARVYSALTGASEAGLQYVLGGVGKLGGKLSGNLAGKLGNKIASQINNAYARFAVQHGAKFIAEMGSEGLEEFLQDVLDPYFKSIATVESPESVDWEQAIYSGLLGALSAGAMNSVSDVSNRVSGLSNANQIIKYGKVGTVKEIGSTYSPESLAYKMAQGLTDKTGRWKLSDTLTALKEELGSQNKADIKNALMSKGIDEVKAERYSGLFDKAFNGGILTKNQQKEIFNDSDLTHVFKALQSKDSVISKRNQKFDEVGVRTGSLGTDFESIYKGQKTENLTKKINLEAELKQLATENAKRKFGVGSTVSQKTDAMIDSMVDDAVKQYGAKAKNKIAKTEASIQNDGKVSETGKTVLISSGEEVNIKKIKSIDPEKKELTFELDNGKTVSNRDIKYANSNVALAYESMANLGYDLDTANAMVQILSTNSVKPNNQLLLGLNKAYEYGWGHIPESARTDADFNALTDTQKSMAIKLGEDARLANDKAREESIPNAQNRVAKKNNGKEFSAKLDADINHIPGRAKVSVKALDEIAKKLQINFIIKDLKGVSNGWYSEKENAIVIDINAGTNGANTLLWTASHELVHYFRRWNPSDFTALADFLMQRYSENGKNIDELIAIEQDKAFKATKGKDIMSFDAAYEEVVAQAMQEFLTDSNFITELSTLQKSNPGLVQKIIDTLRKILEDIREWYNGLTPSDKATEYVKEMGEAANEMYDMLSKGLFKASETSMAKVDNTASTKVTKTETAEMQNEEIQSVADVATDTDGNQLFQYKAMEADEQKYRNMLTKHGLMSESKIDYLFNTVDMALEKIKSNLEALDYAWETDIDERGFNPIKPNSDPLYKVSLDFSTLCRKRILQQVIQAQLQEALNTQLTREEGIAIRNELMQIQEEGRQIEIACALCYVESARMKSNKQIKKFLKDREQIIKEFFAGTNPGEIKQKIKDAEDSKRQELIKRFNNDAIATMSLKEIKKEYGGKVAQEIRDAKKAVKGQYSPTAEEQRLIDKANTMSISDFTTPEGLENLVKNYPRLFDAYTSFIRNATKSKGIENDTWWRAGDSYSVDKNGDPVLSDALVDAMNRENGLRAQSWSDFQVIHILDYMAAIIELSTRNAKMQTYTKVEDLVHLMGNTNLMINLSLIPTRTFNGKLEFDSVEGMLFKTALELRDKYHATAGTISIGINDEQIRMLLESGLIDYVIPYHKSGMSQAIRNLMHIPTWDEYENYQNESVLNSDNAKENAKKYGVKLNTDKDVWHKTPNFSDWFDLDTAKQISKTENANPSNKAEAKKYGVMYGSYKAMQNAAEEYKRVCAERGLAPKFEQFLDESNYWKLLIDRKMIDNITGEIIEQKAVTPQFDRGEVMRILDDEVARYPKVKADQDYAINEVVKRFLNKDFKSKANEKLKLSEDTENALTESVNGISVVNILSSSQDSYYDNPELTDVKHQYKVTADQDAEYLELAKNPKKNEARLKELVDEAAKNAGFTYEAFHGSKVNGITVFKPELDQKGTKSLFFSSSDYIAKTYGKEIYHVYVSDENLLRIDADNNYYYGIEDRITHDKAIDKLVMLAKEYDNIQQEYFNNAYRGSSKYTAEDVEKARVAYENYKIDMYSDIITGSTNSIAKKARNQGYDGVIFENVRDTGPYSRPKDTDISATDYVLFNSNQVKSADLVTYDGNGNIIPLSERFRTDRTGEDAWKNEDIRYQYRDSEGNELSKGQQEYFKDSKVRDENGNLLVVYHGTPNKFTIFNQGTAEGWGRGIYFTDIKEETTYYGENVVEAYVNITNPFDTRTMSYRDVEVLGYETNAYKEFDYKQYQKYGKYDYDSYKEYQEDGQYTDMFMIYEEYIDVFNSILRELGYDGIIGDHTNNINGLEIVAFNENQPKLTTNLNPTSDPDIKYQYRDLDATDNRTLLANALASTAQNEIEKKYIEQYQKKIDTINAEQKKLTELRAKIKELSFAKGKRDVEQIRKLQADATKTANRINTFDKQLLKLESAKPLAEVLKREKDLAKKKAEKAGREALDAYKERAAKTQRELMDRYQERIKKGKEGRDKTELRHKIIKKVKELNNLLLKGDKDRHVPIALQKSTALALQAINMDTVNADERIAKIREKIAKSNNPEQIEKWQKSIDRIELQGENMMAKLDALDRAYEDIKNSNDPLIANVYDDGIKQAIVNLKNEVGNTPLREMSLGQLESVYDMYKMVLYTIRNANKAFKIGKQETITELGNNVMREVESVGGKKKYTIKALDFVKKFSWLNLKPVYAMRAIGSKTLAKLFDNVRAGEDTWAVDVSEAREYFLDKAKKYNYNSWDFDQRYTFKSNTGKEFSLSIQDIMSLYAYSKREQADRHLTMGGFVFDDAAEIIKNKKGIPVKYKVNISDAHNISMQTLSEIINTLTPEQMAFVNDMQKYLADDMGAKGNEVSRAMYDIDLFKDKNYFPLKSAKQFMFEQNEVAGEVRIKNSGFTKSTVPNANNPIILKGFMDVWSEHVSDMAMYHSFVLPLEDFNRVWNYKTPTAENLDTESVKMVLQNAYGRQANDYIKQMLTDLNGGARSQQGAEITNKLISLFKKGAVFASASVVIQQPSAIARAMAYIDAKYFAKATPSAWNLKNHSADWAEVKKYAPVAIIKEMGYFDTNMGKQTTDWITSTEYEGFGEKAKALVTDSGFRDEMLSKAPALADEIAWVHIWNAVKKEVADTNKALSVGSEDFLKECGKRFTEVVVNTQVYDSVLSRSALMRSKDTGVKMATAFMAESTTSINMIADALIQGKRGNKKFARKAIGAVAAQMILNSILVSLVYAGRDDDDDKTYAEKYLGTLVGTTLDAINPLSLIPYVKDIVSIAHGYDVERSDMAVISALWNAYQNLSKESISPYKKVENFAGSIANLFGLPLKNIMRDARACYNIVNSFINGNETTAKGIKRSIVEEITGDDANKQMKNELIDAMESGDSAKIKESIQDMLDSGKEKSAIQSLLTSYWKPLFLEAYKMNDNAEMAKIRKALNATGIYKDVVKTTQDWIKKSKSE